MQLGIKLISSLLLASLALSACRPAAPAKEAGERLEAKTPEPAMAEGTPGVTMKETTPEAMAAETAGPALQSPTGGLPAATPSGGEMAKPQAMADAPAWFTASLVDARSGESFSIQDFKGKVLLIEAMAVWCSSCLRQQQQVKALHEQLGERDDFISLGLDIDPNEDAAVLKDFIDANGFGWTYAVAPREVARELGQRYGDQFLNPPSTPMLIIDRLGQVHLLPFGVVKSVAELQAALEPFLSAGT